MDDSDTVIVTLSEQVLRLHLDLVWKEGRFGVDLAFNSLGHIATR